jgi:hypothetical protein
LGLRSRFYAAFAGIEKFPRTSVEIGLRDRF